MEVFSWREAVVVVKQGNLVEENVDAIVCPANSFNHMRGGVAGVIRRQGGDVIEQEAMAKAPVPIGKAVITTAGTLPARYVIHAPTMQMPVQRTTTDAVAKAVRAALCCAEESNLHSISFPGMGTGTGWVPYEDAAEVMLLEIKHFLSEENRNLGIINIVAYSELFYDVLINTAQRIFKSE